MKKIDAVQDLRGLAVLYVVLFHAGSICEIEYFVTDNDPANGKAVIWVKVPTLNSVSNETIYIWYNKAGESQPGRGSTNGSECVWNGNYRLVMHMNQSPSGAASILDSTGNLNHFTSYNMDGTNLVDGKYGKCLRFNGTALYRSSGSGCVVLPL